MTLTGNERAIAILSTALVVETIALVGALRFAYNRSLEADKYAAATVYCTDVLARNDIQMDPYDLIAMLTILG